jgi:protein phosphatase 1G
LLYKRTLYVANAGDSRTVLCRNGEALMLSVDHKPELPNERARIEKAGGFVSDGRVNGNLNLTRALGDFEYKSQSHLKAGEQVISAVPEIQRIELNS